MKPLLSHGIFGMLCLATLHLSSCGGTTSVAGGGGISGTGTQTIAVGQVTDFGSIWVGGSEYFPKSGSKILFSFDNFSTSQESALQLGMSVSVKGSFNETLHRFEYAVIDYRPELRGPLAEVVVASSQLMVLGKLVRVNNKTLFAGVTNLAGLDAIKGQQPEVEISGHINNLGEIIATRVALVSPTFAAGTPVQLKGTVSNPTANSITIGSQTITLTGATLVNLQPSDLVAGLFVEVKGSYNGTNITALRIERKLPLSGAASGGELELRGLALTAVTSDNSLLVAGPDGPVTVTVTTSTTYRRGGTPADKTIVTSDTIVEVKGILQSDQSLAATEINAENPG